MQLLLFLSALLAGLTGAFSGDRAMRVGGHQSEATITRTAEVAAEVASAIVDRRVLARHPATPPRSAATIFLQPAPLALPVHLTMGRRLE